MESNLAVGLGAPVGAVFLFFSCSWRASSRAQLLPPCSVLKHLAKEWLPFHRYVDKDDNDEDTKHSELQAHGKHF